MNPPLVSVCVPAYNNSRTIDAVIRSVLGQTLGDFELVVVDDRSSDGTAAIVRSHSDPRIRLVENERNLGHEGNWNKALKEAGAGLSRSCRGTTSSTPGAWNVRRPPLGTSPQAASPSSAAPGTSSMSGGGSSCAGLSPEKRRRSREGKPSAARSGRGRT
jgi:Glycosyltransferases involved in cell wall biogenesis